MALRDNDYGREITRGTTRPRQILWCEIDAVVLVGALVMMIVLPSGFNPKFVLLGAAIGIAGVLGLQAIFRRDPRMFKKLRAHRRWKSCGSARLSYFVDERTPLETAAAFLGLRLSVIEDAVDRRMSRIRSLFKRSPRRRSGRTRRGAGA